MTAQITHRAGGWPSRGWNPVRFAHPAPRLPFFVAAGMTMLLGPPGLEQEPLRPLSLPSHGGPPAGSIFMWHPPLCVGQSLCPFSPSYKDNSHI